MKELTEQQVLEVLDCWMDQRSETECRTCPLRGLKKPGGCRKLAHDAVVHHIRKMRLQLESVCGTLEDLEKKDPNKNYGVRVKVRNGLIFAKTCEDYDHLIGDISQSAVSEMASELFDRIWKDRPDEVRVPFDGRFVNKAEFIKEIRRAGGLE